MDPDSAMEALPSVPWLLVKVFVVLVLVLGREVKAWFGGSVVPLVSLLVLF